MKFSELTVKEKIQHVKDNYVEIVSEVIIDNNYLYKLIPEIKDEPIFVEPKLYTAKGFDKKNEEALKLARENFSVKKKEYEDRKNTIAKILDSIKSIKEIEDCECDPKEFEIDVDNIAPEFEIFIDFARARAEAKNY